MLSDLVLQGDAGAVEGTEDLFEQAQRTTEVDLVVMAQDEARNLTTQLMLEGSLPPERAQVAAHAWVTGFLAGVRISRDLTSSSLPQEPEQLRSQMFLGIDEASVLYMARQRGMRAADQLASQGIELAAAGWLDGATIGLLFDTRAPIRSASCKQPQAVRYVSGMAAREVHDRAVSTGMTWLAGTHVYSA